LYFSLSFFLPFCLSVFLSFCLSVFLSFCLSVFLSLCLCLSVFVSLSFCLFIVQFFCLSDCIQLLEIQFIYSRYLFSFVKKKKQTGFSLQNVFLEEFYKKTRTSKLLQNIKTFSCHVQLLTFNKNNLCKRKRKQTDMVYTQYIYILNTIYFFMCLLIKLCTYLQSCLGDGDKKQKANKHNTKEKFYRK
jgi:hypothetical protein